MLKYGLVGHKKLFQVIRQNIQSCQQLDNKILQSLIVQSCRIKARYVHADYQDVGKEQQNEEKLVKPWPDPLSHGMMMKCILMMAVMIGR